MSALPVGGSARQRSGPARSAQAGGCPPQAVHTRVATREAQLSGTGRPAMCTEYQDPGYDKADQDVAFPFGFGLSYTTFELSDLSVSTSGSVADGTFGARVSVTVANTGDRDGAEVVQVYVEDVLSEVATPPRQLRGFAKVALVAGERTQVSIDLDQWAFSFWSDRHRRWAVEAGEFVVAVGRHSRDLPLRASLHVEAPSLTAPLTAASTLQEWVADPVGAELLGAEMAAAPGAGAGPGLDDDVIAIIGNFPMKALASFPGMVIDRPTLDLLSEQWAARQGR